MEIQARERVENIMRAKRGWILLAFVLAWPVHAQDHRTEKYPDEEIYDTRVFPDEAASNITLANCRWPDCTTNRTAITDIFRIEGAKSDQEKALALWKWFRILVSPTGGGYMYEGALPGKEEAVRDPHKILTVYGHHMCDGQSWSMVSLWRAAGYVAFDECHGGHTIASLRYRDADGNYRFHDFDPQHRFYYWDGRHERVGTWTVPLLRGLVHRHLVVPQEVHTLRTSLRLGETIERRWENEGHVIAADPPPLKIDLSGDGYYGHKPGRRNGVYAIAGTEVQTFEADLSAENFSRSTFEGSRRVARVVAADGKAMLCPEKAGETATIIYRLASPYPAVEAVCQAEFTKINSADLCRVSISRDGVTWTPVFDKATVGDEKVALDLGREARAQGRGHVYTAYTFFIKAELSSAKNPTGVGLKGLRLAAYRELNQRTLPNLMPGTNVFRVGADMAVGSALDLEINYRLEGKPIRVVRRIARFPHYFQIDVPEGTRRVPAHYEQSFNDDVLKMESIRVRIVPATGALEATLPEREAEGCFRASYPHPINLSSPKEVEAVESDPAEVNGFFPQRRRVSTDKVRLAKILESYQKGGDRERWEALEELGDFPEMVDFLCRELAKSNIDESRFIAKALAQIADKKAVPALLERWNRGPAAWTPGARYIPDALAAIGDPSVVPALVARLETSRFDVRFHVAHAVGILGGASAEEALRDLAKNDPFPAVREEAEECLRKLKRHP
jgi:hypothetical protein